MAKKILTGIIRAYQRVEPFFYIPGFLGFYGGCRFSPSCSEYSIAAMEKNGLLKGFVKSTLRILKCGPWSKGGVDLP